MDNKFFTFIKPYLSFIDKGDFFRKPFSWLYIAFAVLNLILPFYILYTAIDNNIFDTPAKFIIVFILVWIVIAFAGWVCFQLWWDRKNKVTETSVENSEFVVTPVFAHFIQTFGEWIGTWIGIVGFCGTISYNNIRLRYCCNWSSFHSIRYCFHNSYANLWFSNCCRLKISCRNV